MNKTFFLPLVSYECLELTKEKNMKAISEPRSPWPQPTSGKAPDGQQPQVFEKHISQKLQCFPASALQQHWGGFGFSLVFSAAILHIILLPLVFLGFLEPFLEAIVLKDG
jgi:hypothetical protein